MPRSLPLRQQQPPDDVVVIRGGTLSAESIRRAAERTFDAYAVYGLSVVGALDRTVLEVCGSERIRIYRRIRLSTFGRVRGGGFALLATFEEPHFTLVLPDLAELTIARLVRCFGEPLPNPARSPGR